MQDLDQQNTDIPLINQQTQNLQSGLSSEEAAKRLAEQGENKLPEAPPPKFIFLFLKQFKSPFIYVLLVAALVSFSLAQNVNGFFILAVLLLNALIGSFQEFSAEKAASSLNAMVPQLTNVLRDGHRQSINSKELVIGDLFFLASGDRVPADALCLEVTQLTLDESMLTGESVAVSKLAVDPAKLKSYENPQEPNKCFAGTSVVKGRGLLQVTATGINTEIGKIASAVSRENKIKPPLLQRIERFTLKVTIATLLIIGLIFIVSLTRGDALTQIFFLGVALAVSAIPEGLPAAITVALAIGMRRMAKVNVIVRSLLSVESLGSCTYIASDKTGTLTVNDLTVEKILLHSGEMFKVSGQGLELDGEIKAENEQHSAGSTEVLSEGLKQLCRAGTLCNEAELYFKDQQWHSEGDQVDIALLVLYNKTGQTHQSILQQYPEIMRLPYESENAYSAALNQVKDKNQLILSVKGSVEKLLPLSNLTKQATEQILKQVDQLATQGYRVLALADKQLETCPATIESEINELNFIGLIGIIDPLRKSAIPAIESCRKAKIEVAMITGDHPETAKTIAKQLGIFNSSEQVILGEQISQLHQSDPDKLRHLVTNNHVFARVKPVEKQLIVEHLQQQGHFVAVTGDGVNDAPALKTAHVGIAMGKRGTDVARENANLILTDDNFSSIVNGIIEGRVVYSNIRKVVFLLISTGAAEIFLFILSLLAGLPLPLYPIQLLWLNLVTNGIQDVALAFEPAEGNEINQPPRSPKESIFNRLMIERVIINALIMGSIAFALFAICLQQGMDESQARNMTLLLMVLFENVHALNSRSETVSLFKMRLFSNKLLILGILCAQSIHIGAMYSDWLKSILQIEPVTLDQWFYLLLIALFLILVDEVHKMFHRKN